MGFSCKIKVKNNFKKIDKHSGKILNVTKESVEDILQNIQVTAIKLERGHNSNGILAEIVDFSKKEVKGKVYAKPEEFMIQDGVSYLFFEYFGTGAYAEQPHIGKTKHFKESGYTEWYIPVKKVKRTLNYPIVTIGDCDFYVATGTKANHFLTDSEFKTRQENVENVKRKIEQMLKEVTNG